MNQIKVLYQDINIHLVAFSEKTQHLHINSVQHPSPHFSNPGTHFGVSSIYFLDGGLQEVVHICQIMVVRGTKDKMSFEKLIKTDKRVQ